MLNTYFIWIETGLFCESMLSYIQLCWFGTLLCVFNSVPIVCLLLLLRLFFHGYTTFNLQSGPIFICCWWFDDGVQITKKKLFDIGFYLPVALTNMIERAGIDCGTLYIFIELCSDFLCCCSGCCSSYSFCSQSFNLSDFVNFFFFFFIRKMLFNFEFHSFLLLHLIWFLLLLFTMYVPSRINERYFDCCLWMKRWNRLPALGTFYVIKIKSLKMS